MREKQKQTTNESYGSEYMPDWLKSVWNANTPTRQEIMIWNGNADVGVADATLKAIKRKSRT